MEGDIEHAEDVDAAIEATKPDFVFHLAGVYAWWQGNAAQIQDKVKVKVRVKVKIKAKGFDFDFAFNFEFDFDLKDFHVEKNKKRILLC